MIDEGNIITVSTTDTNLNNNHEYLIIYTLVLLGSRHTTGVRLKRHVS